MKKLIFLPTIIWAFGLLEFLFYTLIYGPVEQTKGFALIATAIFVLYALIQARSELGDIFLRFKKEFQAFPFLFKLTFLFVIVLLGLALFEARHPPHLMEEYDAYNYHMSLARQHLLQGTLGHISWSVADLWPSMIQWGFAPYWFITDTFHRFPQFFASFAVFILLILLGRRLIGRDCLGYLPALAFISTHGVMIQLGTAMFDLTGLYFLLACFYLLLAGKNYFAFLHLAVYLASKAFFVAQIGGVIALLFIVRMLSRRRVSLRYISSIKLPIIALFLFTCLFMSRTFYVDLQRTGTPLFPFLTCTFVLNENCQSESKLELKNLETTILSYRNAYGEGRTLKGFLTHLWKVAVPIKSLRVNNNYDYPLGLAWLLFVVLLLYSIPTFFKERFLPISLCLALGFWLMWWLGSQQSRWLYPVLAFGLLGCRYSLQRANVQVLSCILLLSASTSLVAKVRSLKANLFTSSYNIQLMMERKVMRDSSGTIRSKEVLYVNEPVLENSNDELIWVFPKK